MSLFLKYSKHIMKRMKNGRKKNTVYDAFFSVNKVFCRLNFQIKTHILDKTPFELKLPAGLIIPWHLNNCFLDSCDHFWTNELMWHIFMNHFFSVLSRKQIKKRISKIKDWKQGVFFFVNYVCDKDSCYIAKIWVLF